MRMPQDMLLKILKGQWTMDQLTSTELLGLYGYLRNLADEASITRKEKLAEAKAAKETP